MYAIIIRTLRTDRGLTQGELARLVGVSRVCVQHWESEISCPCIQHIKPLCRALQVSPSDFLDWEERGQKKNLKYIRLKAIETDEDWR